MIRLKEVKKSFNGIAVLDGITLTVKPGEAVALIGASGSGKTTMIRILNGFVTPDSGWVQVAGQTVDYHQKKNLRQLRKRVGMIYQLFNLVDRASVLTNVLAGALGRLDTGFDLVSSTLGFFHQREREKAMELLKFVHLEDKAAERVDRLSGGQKQRVAIARALMQEPDVLLADEPVANLDPQTSNKILELLCRINQEKGITLITVLHHLESVKDFFPRTIALKNGCLCYDGWTGGLTRARLQDIYAIDEVRECRVA